jgi:hypothetical protein
MKINKLIKNKKNKKKTNSSPFEIACKIYKLIMITG